MTDYTLAIHELRIKHYDLVYASWLEHLYSPQWYLLVGLVVVMYTVWWLLVDKARIKTLLLCGSLVAVARVILDLTIAINLGRWVYSVTLLPIAPDIFVHDLTVTPITYMLVYQYANNWKWFFVTNLIGTSLIFYGLLPLFEYLHIFKGFPGWTLTNSFLAIFTAATLARMVVLWLEKIEASTQTEAKQQEYMNISYLAQPACKPNDEDD